MSYAGTSSISTHGNAVFISDCNESELRAVADARNATRIARRCIADGSATVAELRWALRKSTDAMNALLDATGAAE